MEHLLDSSTQRLLGLLPASPSPLLWLLLASSSLLLLLTLASILISRPRNDRRRVATTKKESLLSGQTVHLSRPRRGGSVKAALSLDRGRLRLPPGPPTDALLDFVVPTRSIWPSHYVRAAREAETNARLVLAELAPRHYGPSSDGPRSGSATVDGRSSADSSVTIVSPSPSQNVRTSADSVAYSASKKSSASPSPALTLSPRVRQLLEQIPSTDPSEASDDDDSEDERNVERALTSFQLVAEVGEVSSGSPSISSPDVGPFARLVDRDEAIPRCFPIAVSARLLQSDTQSGRIQTVDPTLSFSALVAAVDTSRRCKRPQQESSAQGSESLLDGRPQVEACEDHDANFAAPQWCLHLVHDDEPLNVPTNQCAGPRSP